MEDENYNNIPIDIPEKNSPIEKQFQEERVSNFLDQTSPTKSLTNIDYILRGYSFDKETNKWVKVSEGIPEKIRLDFLQILTPHLSEDARMSNLSAEQINNIVYFVIEWIADYLEINADRFKLTEEQMTKIGLIVVSAIFYTLLRAQNGIERSEMFDSLRMNESRMPQGYSQENPKKDWWKVWK